MNELSSISGQSVVRCPWSGSHPLYTTYHDESWGVPVHDDRRLFEMLILEGAQAGLSWLTVLKKQENYRKAFSNFDPSKIARYDSQRVQRLLENAKIIRNRLKIEGAVSNAHAFLAIQKDCGTFDRYIWEFVGGKPRQNTWSTVDQIPSTTAESETMSKDLKHRGFTFVGSTICYAFMQATGMVNDHLVNCFRYQFVRKLR